MASSRLRLLLVGLVIFLLALPFYLPASLLVSVFGDRIPPQLSWRQVGGTLFAPRLYSPVFQTGPGTALVFTRADARIALLPLLLGRLGLRFKLQTDGHAVDGQAMLASDRWELANVHGSLPVAPLLSLLPAAGLEVAGGVVLVDINRMSGRYYALPDAAQLVLTVEQFHPVLQGLTRPLGNFELSLQPDPETQAITGTLKTADAESPLQVDARILMNATDRVLRLDGRAQAASFADEAVRSLIPLFGAVENGTARFAWRIPL